MRRDKINTTFTFHSWGSKVATYICQKRSTHESVLLCTYYVQEANKTQRHY